MSFKISLADDITVDPPVDGYCIVHRQSTSKYFRLGVCEATFLAGLDGQRTVDQLKTEAGFRPDQIDALLVWFRQHQLLNDCNSAVTETPQNRMSVVSQALLRWDDWRITLFQPNAFFDRHRVAVNALFGRPAILLYLLAVISPAVLLIINPSYATHALQNYSASLTVWGWVTLYVAILLTIAVHELAHGVTCKRLGGRVGRIGVKLLYLQPVAFCDVSDSWRFESKSSKILVASAGIIIQCVLSGLAVSTWLLSAEPLFAHYALANTIVAALNLFPLTKLDGYWILVHLFNEPNLRKKSLRAVALRFERLTGRGVAAMKNDRGLLLFGVAHIIVLPVVWLLGLAAIYRIGALVSTTFGAALAVAVALLLAYKGFREVAGYLDSTRSRNAP